MSRMTKLFTVLVAMLLVSTSIAWGWFPSDLKARQYESHRQTSDGNTAIAVVVEAEVNTMNGGVKTVTTAGTAEALAGASTTFYNLKLKADPANTGYIYVGGSDVDQSTKNGFALDAGEVWTSTAGDLANIYIDSTVDGEGVGFSYES